MGLMGCLSNLQQLYNKMEEIGFLHIPQVGQSDPYRPFSFYNSVIKNRRDKVEGAWGKCVQYLRNYSLTLGNNFMTMATGQFQIQSLSCTKNYSEV